MLNHRNDVKILSFCIIFQNQLFKLLDMEALSSPAISEVFHLSLQLAPCLLQNLTSLSNFPTTTTTYSSAISSTIMMQISTITTLSLLLTPCIASPLQRSSAIRFQIAIIPSEMEVATSQKLLTPLSQWHI